MGALVGPEPHFFATPQEFRRWLARHHAKETELLVGFWRKGTGRPSIDWPQAVDEALCFGWIDGIRRSVDGEAFSIRFTPRRKGSVWSQRNVERVAALEAGGRMTEAGRAAWAARQPGRSGLYSFEQGEVALSPAHVKRLRGDRAGWAFWQAQPASYVKTATWWVVSAKQEATRERRLTRLAQANAAGERLPQFVPPGGRRPPAQA